MRVLDDLEIILDLINRIEQTVEGQTAARFSASHDALDAVAYRLGMIGEHCKRLLDDLKERYPGLPWADMVGLRNIVVHGYDNVSPAIIWQTATQHLDSVRKMADAERIRLTLERSGPSKS